MLGWQGRWFVKGLTKGSGSQSIATMSIARKPVRAVSSLASAQIHWIRNIQCIGGWGLRLGPRPTPLWLDGLFALESGYIASWEGFSVFVFYQV